MYLMNLESCSRKIMSELEKRKVEHVKIVAQKDTVS
jgi:hypothetical protein